MGMMFGGGDLGMGGGSGLAVTGQMVSIGGLDIEGMYVVPSKGAPELTDMPEPIFPFSVPPQESPALDQTDQTARQSGASSPEILFLERLRSSRLFSSDVKMTALKLFKQNPDFKNVGNFTIQVKLEFQLEFMQYGSR